MDHLLIRGRGQRNLHALVFFDFGERVSHMSYPIFLELVDRMETEIVRGWGRRRQSSRSPWDY